MKRTAEPTVIKTVSVSLLGGFALELDGTAAGRLAALRRALTQA